MLRQAGGRQAPWDIVVVGGGATGVAVALDAATRGYGVLLLEQSDFGKGTSSRSTKLIHGGVRYLEQGNVPLVMEALRERGLLARNAPDVVRNLEFVVPCYEWWEAPFYGAGMKLYNLLAGRLGFGPSRILSREETLERLPGVRPEGLRGGVVYYDAQFDDCRLLLRLAAAAVAHGAVVLNYATAAGLTRDAGGRVNGVRARDAETGAEFEARARVVVNAAGPFSDEVRHMADPFAKPVVAPSQGVHITLPGAFLGGESAIMVPRTGDGRVIFAIPWYGHTLIGTTDTPLSSAVLEPVAQEREISFLLHTASIYLARRPSRSDVLSVFAGIRPLVASGASGRTASLARSHLLRVERSGLLTICGGKWTTCRRMAEETVNAAASLAGLPPRACITRQLELGDPSPAPGGGEPLDPALPYTAADIVWAARRQMARTVEDALARRTRALFLNARAALRIAPVAAESMARELGRDRSWVAAQIASFAQVAKNYLPA